MGLFDVLRKYKNSRDGKKQKRWQANKISEFVNKHGITVTEHQVIEIMDTVTNLIYERRRPSGLIELDHQVDPHAEFEYTGNDYSVYIGHIKDNHMYEEITNKAIMYATVSEIARSKGIKDLTLLTGQTIGLWFSDKSPAIYGLFQK